MAKRFYLSGLLQQSFDALFPFTTKEKIWTGKQIKPFKFSGAFPLLLMGSTKLNCDICIDAVKKMPANNAELLLINLL